MSTQTKNVNASADTTTHITRIFCARRQRVYAAWTNLELLRQWWGPEGVETHELVFEARVGGKFRWVLSTPEDERMTIRGEFHEVRSGEKLVFTWQSDHRDMENSETIVTIEFREKNAITTELHLTHEDLPSEASRDEHTAGWNSALDKLDHLLTD